MGEHLPCKQGVRSSILLISTKGEHLPCKQGVRSSILLISTKGEGRREIRRLNNMGL